jgi:phage gpG-like protein
MMRRTNAVAIETIIDATGPATALGRLAGKLRNRTVPNRRLSVQLYGWTMRNYDGRGSLRPSGPWRPLAPATVKQKIRLGYSPEPLAPRSGNLRVSFAGFSDNDSAGVGARASYGVDYARVHEEGAGRVPARPMLPPAEIASDYSLRVYTRFIDASKKDAGL